MIGFRTAEWVGVVCLSLREINCATGFFLFHSHHSILALLRLLAVFVISIARYY